MRVKELFLPLIIRLFPLTLLQNTFFLKDKPRFEIQTHVGAVQGLSSALIHFLVFLLFGK